VIIKKQPDDQDDNEIQPRKENVDVYETTGVSLPQVEKVSATKDLSSKDQQTALDYKKLLSGHFLPPASRSIYGHCVVCRQIVTHIITSDGYYSPESKRGPPCYPMRRSHKFATYTTHNILR
jgi:hypothetical protein